MRNDVGDEVNITVNKKVESPVEIDTGLPEVTGFIVLLGVQ